MFSFLREKDGQLEDFFVDYVINKKMITELALEIGISRIADVIAKCGFSVISREDTREIEYMLNVKPNPNQNATDFWKQAVYRTIKNDDGCVLINTINNGLYIADTWRTNDRVLQERKYFDIDVIVDNDRMRLQKSYKASDIVHLRYSNPKLIKLLAVVNDDFSELLDVAKIGYKSLAPKVKVSMPSGAKIQDADTGEVLTTNQYAKKIAEKLSSGEIKSIVAHSGIDISYIEGKSTLSHQDIKALRDNIFETTAMALGIPKSIYFGDVSDQANDEFITYACEPVMAIIDNAVCGAWLSKDEYARGDRIIVNKVRVKHVDIIESAGNLDKLYQNGWSHNDIMRVLGLPKVSEAWADKRRFTKNYAEEGGE